MIRHPLSGEPGVDDPPRVFRSVFRWRRTPGGRTLPYAVARRLEEIF